jgi:hypothetical protein
VASAQAKQEPISINGALLLPGLPACHCSCEAARHALLPELLAGVRWC